MSAPRSSCDGRWWRRNKASLPLSCHVVADGRWTRTEHPVGLIKCPHPILLGTRDQNQATEDPRKQNETKNTKLMTQPSSRAELEETHVHHHQISISDFLIFGPASSAGPRISARVAVEWVQDGRKGTRNPPWMAIWFSLNLNRF